MDIEIIRNGSRPSSKGPSDWFTGATRVAYVIAKEATWRKTDCLGDRQPV